MKIRIIAILLLILIASSACAETISARQQHQYGSWGDIVIELNYDENVSSNILETSLGEGAPTASEAGYKQALALRFVQYNAEEEGWYYLPAEQGGLQVILSADPYD